MFESFTQTASPLLKNGMEHSERLHFLLTQLLAGTPLDIVLNTRDGEGLETHDYGDRPASGDEDGRMHHGSLVLPFHHRHNLLRTA